MENLIRVEYPDEQRYWDGKELFTYMGDCDIIMAISIRNIGKTYTFFKNIRKQLAQGNNVAISRYDRTELGVTITDFLRYYEETDDEGNLVCHYTVIKPKIKDVPIHIYQFDNGARAYFFCIKDSPNLKGMEIVNLKRWYIDEFVPIIYKFQTRKYKEFDYFVELYHTVLRSNTDLKIMMSANCKNWMNPYFMGWEIPMFNSGYIMKIVRNGLKIAIENVEPSVTMRKAFVDGELKMGKNMDDIQRTLKQYACDPDCFIAKSDNATDTGIQIKIKGEVYGIYVKNGKDFVRSEKLDMNKDRYLLTPIEYDEYFVYEPAFVKQLEKILFYNQMRFDSRKTEFNVRLGIWLSKTRKV